jgi:hypothetical protein
MKYSITLSFFVLCVVVSTQIVDTLADGYFLERGRPLFGYRSGTSGVLNNKIIDNLQRYNETNINGTMYGYVDPTQQPSSTGIFVWIDQWIKSITGIGAIFSTIFYCTIGFGQYINNIFYMPLGGHYLLNDILCGFIGTCVCIIHFLNIIAFIRGMQIGD